MIRGKITKAILAELERNPNRTSDEIAVAAGSTAGSVRGIASRNGVSFGDKAQRRRFSDENWQWLCDTAKKERRPIAKLLDSIVTDARCEDEEAGNG